jgi:hypothetical protein
MDKGVWVLAFGVGDRDWLPRGKLVDLAEQTAPAPPECDEPHTLGIECGQVGIGGEARIEDPGGFYTPLDGCPEG